jgi:Starch synthase catalytic domain
MKILFVAAEAAPVAKVGGMGDVVGALPKFLRQMGHDVRIFLPYYGFLPDKMEIPEEPIWRGYAMFQDFDVYESVVLMFLCTYLDIQRLLLAISTQVKMKLGDLCYFPTEPQNFVGIIGNQILSIVTIGTQE